MIESMKTNVEGDKLTVYVTCSIREFAVHPIKELTTEELIDKLKEEYDIQGILEFPKKRIGNTNRRKMSNSGTWIFTIKKESKVEKSKPKRTRKTQTTKPKPKPKTTTNSSIRNRISKLATKEN